MLASLGNVLLVLLIMVLVAFLIETLVEFIFAPIFKKWPKLAPYKDFVMYVAIATGVLAAFLYNFDLIFLLASYLGAAGFAVTIFGKIITGIAIGKGSNYLHDLIQKYFVKANLQIQEITPIAPAVQKEDS
jgi:hypothetical protein